MRTIVTALALALVLGLTSPAAAQPQEGSPRDVALQHYRTGEAKFQAGDYRAAMVAFLAADAIAPSATLIYNVALCHERLDEPGEAARRYREYLSRRKDAPNRAELEARIATLEAAARGPQPLPPEYPDGDGLSTPRSLGPDPMSPVAPTAEPERRPYDEAFARRVPSSTLGRGEAEAAPLGPERAPPAPAPLPAPEPRKEKALYKQWWFWVFVGVGAVILIDIASTAGDDGGDRAASTPRGLTLIKF